MPYIVNAGGRVVAVDDMDEYEILLKKEGFRAATPQEERNEVMRAMALIAKNEETETEQDIYMATVTLGGKDGYGMAAQKLMDQFGQLGVKIGTSQQKQKIGFLFHSPQALIRLDNPFKIVYTMFESDKIPDEWRDYLDEADRVLVPSRWCMEVFAKEGINAEVVPLGFDDTVFKFIERKPKRETREDFVFLHYNAFNIRKGFLEVYEAFRKAFDPSEPVKLVLKTTVADPYSRFPFISKEKDPKVQVISESYSTQDLVKLLGQADCFLFPSRGEGFGLPPLEAMATGLPTIVPNAHGISEYFNEDFMYEAKVEKTCPAIYTRYKGQDVGEMVVCDSDQMARQMRYIYEHQEEALEKGKLASEYVLEWTYKRTASKLKEVFDEFLVKDVKDKRINNVLPLEEVI